MNINIIVLFSILIIHYIADFCLQTEYQGMNKWHSVMALCEHTFMYSAIWFFISIFYYFIDKNILIIAFAPITFVLHTSTDYFTSKISHEKYNDYHFYGFTGFWSVIGFDQILHIVQLVLTYQLLK